MTEEDSGNGAKGLVTVRYFHEQIRSVEDGIHSRITREMSHMEKRMDVANDKNGAKLDAITEKLTTIGGSSKVATERWKMVGLFVAIFAAPIVLKLIEYFMKKAG